MDFHRDFPRETKAAFRNTVYAADRLNLVDLEMRAVPPGLLPNLKKTTPDNQPQSPIFEWDPPIRRPAAGIREFAVNIEGTGNVPGPSRVSGDARDIGELKCFADDGSLISCFVEQSGVVVFNIDRVTYVQLTLGRLLNDGRYSLSVTPTDNLGQTGVTTTRTFTMDTIPPTDPVPTSPSNGAFTNNPTPLLDWEDSVDLLSDVTYDVQVDISQFFTDPLTLIHRWTGMDGVRTAEGG